MNIISTRAQAEARAKDIIAELRWKYCVPQALLAELGACSEVMEGRKDLRDRRTANSYGRRQGGGLTGRRKRPGASFDEGRRSTKAKYGRRYYD